MPRSVAMIVAVAVGATSLTGCAPLADFFNTVQGQGGQAQQAVTPPTPSATTTDRPFDSTFTYDGSVSLSSEVADGLELRLDVWAVNPKRTGEWTTTNEKQFGYAINVFDHRVDEKAVLAQKRRVYVSSLSIASQTAQTSGQVSAPFQFSADPRTLVPSDTLRSDRGLLLNSFQGGLLVPSTSVRQLPSDTYGLTLEFALTVTVEGAADTETSFSQQTVYQYLPIAIFADDTDPGAAGSATDGASSSSPRPGWGH